MSYYDRYIPIEMFSKKVVSGNDVKTCVVRNVDTKIFRHRKIVVLYYPVVCHAVFTKRYHYL